MAYNDTFGNLGGGYTDNAVNAVGSLPSANAKSAKIQGVPNTTAAVVNPIYQFQKQPSLNYSMEAPQGQMMGGNNQMYSALKKHVDSLPTKLQYPSYTGAR